MNEIISVNDLSFSYKENDMLKKINKKRITENTIGIKNISFDVKKGEIFSIIGLNGAGKTTILKCILEFIRPDSGEISLFGRKIDKSTEFEKIGYLPEISYFPRNMKLNDLLKFYGELYNVDKKTLDCNINSTIEKLGLLAAKNNKLSTFSKGMMQKVGVAQAILNRPELLFLDEPMSGLDPITRELVIEIIIDLKKIGTTILFNTHILEDVVRIADRVAIIHKGELVEIFSMKDKIKNDKNFLLRDYFIKTITNQ